MNQALNIEPVAPTGDTSHDSERYVRDEPSRTRMRIPKQKQELQEGDCMALLGGCLDEDALSQSEF